MISIRQKLLLGFCLTALVSIATIGIITSWQLKKSLLQQSKQLGLEMADRIYANLRFPHQTFSTRMRQDIRRSIDDLRQDPVFIEALEEKEYLSLLAILRDTADKDVLHFTALFDLEGLLRASFPSDLNDRDVEKYFANSAFNSFLQQALDETDEEKDPVMVKVSKFEPDMLRAFRLTHWDLSGEGTIGIAAAGLIQDDFGDPIGLCVVGRTFNNYTALLKELYRAGGYTSILYLGTQPLAQAGFPPAENEHFDLNSLALSQESAEEILQADNSSELRLSFGADHYIASCVGLETFEGEKPGSLCIGLPASQVTEVQQSINALGHQTEKRLQTWILAIGAASLIIFVLVAWGMASWFSTPITITSDYLSRIATGDIPSGLFERFSGEFAVIQKNLNTMLRRLADTIAQVKMTADNVALGSRDIDKRARQLSQDTIEQASAAEEVSSSMEQIAANIRQNADNARQTEQIAIRAAEDAQKSQGAVFETVTAMQKIVTKISSIEEIAQQTHLLSLNATIESARAQEHGKGFSVVAAEVRALAERSQIAAREINELAVSSMTVANQTSEMLVKLAPDIQKTAQLVQKISTASHEQSAGVEQINQSIQQLDLVIQQNAETSQTMATVAEDFAGQAERLRHEIAFFNVNGRGKDAHSVSRR